MLNRFKRVRIRVAGVLLKDKKLLLIAHKKGNQVYWLLPGGGVDFGESLTEALKREFQEELGISVQVKDICCIVDSIHPEEERHIVNICFRCSCSEGTLTLGKERRLHDFGFFSRDELEPITIFPPMKEELQQLMSDVSQSCIYLGKKWIEL